MNATEYFDWWHYSGTGLGTMFPGERYQQLHQELSQAGATTVIVSEFLKKNRGGIDIRHWRQMEVFGTGHPAERMQLQLTAEALDTIGANATATAAREAKSGLASLLNPLEPNERNTAIQETMDNVRAQAMSLYPEMLAELPPAVRQQIQQAQRSVRPSQSEGLETYDELVRLLEQYVAAHQGELTRDIEKYGDPRAMPEFDAQRFLDEQARANERLQGFRRQQRDLPDLREKLERLKKWLAADPPQARQLRLAKQDLQEEYQRFAKLDPEELTADVQAWLQEVRQLRKKFPDILQQKASDDAKINARLAAIGLYEVDFSDDEPCIEWTDPPGLDCDWTTFGLAFYLFFDETKPTKARTAKAYDLLIAEWERFRQRFPELVRKLKQCVVLDFREIHMLQLPAEDRQKYEDESGQVADERILDHVWGGTVVFECTDGKEVAGTAHFEVAWDQEHGLDVTLPENGDVMR